MQFIFVKVSVLVKLFADKPANLHKEVSEYYRGGNIAEELHLEQRI
jgi:hypothetical protein